MLTFDSPDGPQTAQPKATVLAMGGGSWPRLGSDGEWMKTLAKAGIALSPLRPANMGFNVDWSDHMADRFAGAPVKTIAMTFGNTRVEGEFTITRNGVEGGVIYTLSAPIRDALEQGRNDCLYRPYTWPWPQIPRPTLIQTAMQVVGIKLSSQNG